MRFHYFVPLLCLILTACVQPQLQQNFDGLKTNRILVKKKIRAQSGDLQRTLAESIRVCWLEQESLFEGFQIKKIGNAILLDGPLKGNPPQRFLIVFSAPDATQNFKIEMEYPKDSNFQFVYARLVKDLKKLEFGEKPC